MNCELAIYGHKMSWQSLGQEMVNISNENKYGNERANIDLELCEY